MNATVPLASLTIDDECLTLRPRLFAKLMSGPFRLRLGDVAVAYPVRTWLQSRGVGLDTGDGQTAYFWTVGPAQDQVLAALAGRGISIDPSPRRATAMWTLRASRPARSAASVGSAASQAPPTSWLQRGLPLGMAASLVILIILETRPLPVWWRGMIAVIWLLGVISGVRMWRARRRGVN